MNSKTFAAVIEESSVGFTFVGHEEARSFCVLPWDAHRCATVAECVAKLDDMASVYGWTVTGIKHRVRTDMGSVWSTVR
jgi:hypothetical protein